jgi:hypothetical protein
MRQKDKVIFYWFGPLESKTLRPVLWFVLLRSQVEVVCGLHVLACPREDALARLILGDGRGRWTRVQVGYNWET